MRRICNYADNTARISAATIDYLCPSLQRIAGDMLSWSDLNYMKAKPEKLKFTLLGKDNNSTLTLLQVVTLKSLKVVTLQGVQIDFQLKFDDHIHLSVLCSKASIQISVLVRLSLEDIRPKWKVENNAIMYFMQF